MAASPHLPFVPRLLCLAGLLGLLAAPLGAQVQSQTLPAGFDALDGSGSSTSPLGTSAQNRWQLHYDSGEFVGATGAIVIQEVYLRVDENEGAVSWDHPSFEVLMATATTDYQNGSHDTVFDNNLGPDRLVVRPGTQFAGSANGGDWVPVGMTQPFQYDPTSGNDLIIQLRTCGTLTSGGFSMDTEVSSSPIGGARYGHTSDCGAASQNNGSDLVSFIVKIDYVPASPSIVVTPDPMVAEGLAHFEVSQVDPFGRIYFVWSTAGAGPTPTPLGDLEVSEPMVRVPVTYADSTGRLAFDTIVPVTLAGETFYCQAAVEYDGVMQLSNAVAIPVQ